MSWSTREIRWESDGPAALTSGVGRSQSRGVRTAGEWGLIHVSVFPGPPQPDPHSSVGRLIQAGFEHGFVPGEVSRVGAHS